MFSDYVISAEGITETHSEAQLIFFVSILETHILVSKQEYPDGKVSQGHVVIGLILVIKDG